MAGKIVNWIKERWPIEAVLRWSLEEEIAGGSRFAYALGSMTLFTFTIQVVTGVWQLFYYVPTIDHAYNSVMYLRQEVPLGWLVHGLHYWGNATMVVLVAMHAVRVFIWGAYKRPRELAWLTGVALLVLTLAMTFTGALLPWDELGYWAGEVGTSIAGTVPWIGDFLVRFARAGSDFGQLALSRFFVAHVAIIPGLIASLIAIHLVAFRQFGSVGPWREELRRRVGRFWPDQIFKDLLAVSILLLILIALAAFTPAPVTGPADPIDTTYTPKPEWNFLFLYQALKVFKGPWEPVGAVGVPLVLAMVLLFLPFYDRREERTPRRRPVAMGLGLALCCALVVLTFTGYYSAPEVAGRAAVAPPPPKAAPPAPAPLSPAAKRGEEAFKADGCGACHTTDGSGGLLGPDLSSEGNLGRTAAWLADQIRDPKAHRPDTLMPPYEKLPPAEVEDLVAYMMGLTAPVRAVGTAQTTTPPAVTPGEAGPGQHLPRSGEQKPPGPAAEMVGDPEHGAIIFAQICQSCHGVAGTGKVPNPGAEPPMVPALKGVRPEIFSDDAEVFARSLDPWIQHGSMPAGARPMIVMPAFGANNTLTQPQTAQVEAYVLFLNGVDRAQIRHPGIEPRVFFAASVAAFAVAWLVIGALWLRLRKVDVRSPDPG